jgi:small subunit ribosomal protein S17
MAEEEKNESAEETEAAESAEATDAAETTDAEPAGDTPREAADEAADVDVDEAPETPRESAQAAADVEPEEVLPPKERRRRARSAHKGEAGPQRSVEERIAQREADRKAKAAARSRYRKGRGAARKPSGGEGTPAAERVEGHKKIRQGLVVSNAADKTITVSVQSARRHPSYEKIIRRSTKITAHDERNEAGPGDTVRVMETRPMSKTKRWRLVEILDRAK